MRLTNQMRDTFVDTVMNKTPMGSKFSYDNAVVTIQKRSDKTLPTDVQNFIKKHPELILRTPHGLRYALDCTRWINVYLVKNENLESLDLSDIKLEHQKYKEELDSRYKLRNRLRDMAYSVNTLAKLRELMPDLIEYMPADGLAAPASKSLPTVIAGGVVADLLKAGLKVSKKVTK